MVPCRKAGRLLPTVAVLAVGAGTVGAAVAQPAGGPAPLVPRAELASSGVVAAPGPAEGSDGVSPPPAPAARAPEPHGGLQAAAPEPPPADPGISPTSPQTVQQAPAAVAPPPEPPLGEQVPPELEAEEADPPTAGEVLEGDSDPLLPVEVIDAGLARPSEAPPLIDISPEPTPDPPLVATRTLGGEAAQDEQGPGDEDGEVVIPVDPDDLADDEDGTEPGPSPTVRTLGGGLPRTGQDLLPPLASGFLLMTLGASLRLALPPRVSAGAQAPA